MTTYAKVTLFDELRAWCRENPVHWRIAEVKGPFLRTLQEAYLQHKPKYEGEQLRERMRRYCEGTGVVPDWCFGEKYVDVVNLVANHLDRWWRRRELGV